jgi:glycosyltransferase involved in cell wall biosynthesis
MKVLIVYHSGALVNALAIYRAMAANRNVELTVVVPECIAVDRVYHPSGRLEVKRESDSNGYRLVPLPLVDPKRYTLGFDGEGLRRIIKENRPDILHAWDEPLSYCLLQVSWIHFLVSRKSRVLFYGFQNTPFKWGALGRVTWKTTWRLVAGGAAANSEVLTNLRQAGFPGQRPIERIFWGVPTKLFEATDKVAGKRELKLNYDYLVGYVGRLVPEKGLAWLLAALKKLPPEVHCLIIGSGPLRAEIELWSELPSLAGRVHVLDAKPADELPRYLSCMDVLAVPSLTTAHWKEQYGRVIAEAMACGVPVVGSDSGAIPEVVESAGVIVPEGNVSALADGLRVAIFDKARDRLIQEGLRRARDELSDEAMSRRLVRFYQRVLGDDGFKAVGDFGLWPT